MTHSGTGNADSENSRLMLSIHGSSSGRVAHTFAHRISIYLYRMNGSFDEDIGNELGLGNS